MPRSFVPSLFAVPLLALLVAMPASAQEEESFSREGPYLGIEALLAADLSDDDVLDVSEAGGIAGRIGFRMTPEFAMEVEGEWAYLDGRNPWSLSVVSKIYPVRFFAEERDGFFDDRLQPYIVSSIGIIVGDLGRGKEPAMTARIGAGTDWWLTSDVALTGQFVYVGNAGDATDYETINLRAGLTWRY